MYIRFDLPHDESYGYNLYQIQSQVSDWATKQQIPYKEKTIKHAHRITFENDQHYTIFLMTWNSELEYQIIDTKW